MTTYDIMPLMNKVQNEYIIAKEALKILGVTHNRSLNRYTKQFNIRFIDNGKGFPKTYNLEDIERVANSREKKLKEIHTDITANEKVEERKEKFLAPETKYNESKQNGFLDNDPLNKVGKEHFDYLREQLIKDGTYSDKDVGLLQAYCISYQKYIHSVNQSNAELDTTIDNFGNVKISPYFLVADKCLTQMDKIAKTLGIGARSRVGLPIKEPKKESVFDILAKDEEF